MIKNVAIIGNGALTKKYGDLINSFDEVIRLNAGASFQAINENYEYIGDKTTIVAINHWGTNLYEPCYLKNDYIIAYEYINTNNIPILYTGRDAKKYPKNRTINGILDTIYPRITCKVLDVINNDIYNLIYKEYNYEKPTSGLKVIFYLIKNGYTDISLFNFGYTGVHFFDKDFYDYQTNCKIDLNNGHNGKIEMDIINDLKNKGIIKIYE